MNHVRTIKFFLGVILLFFSLFTFSQELEIVEVSIHLDYNLVSYRSQMVELKNNSGRDLEIQNYYLSTNKEKLADSRIQSNLSRFNSTSSFEVKINHYGKYRTFYDDELESKVIYLGKETEGGGVIVIDSVTIPELRLNESYAKIDGKFSVQKASTPGLKNWHVLEMETQSQFELQLMGGLNLNMPKGTAEFNNSSGPLPGYQLGARLIYNMDLWFVTMGTGLINKYYRLNSFTEDEFPIGTLKRDIKGFHRVPQWNFFIEGGVRISPRLSLSVGQGLGVNLAGITNVTVNEELTLTTGDVKSDVSKQKTRQGPTLELFASLDLQYHLLTNVTVGTKFTRDQFVQIESGSIRYRTLEFYGAYTLHLSRGRSLKRSLKRIF